MSRSLHSQKFVDGRAIFGGEERDKLVRKSQEVFNRAQDRKDRRALQRAANIRKARGGEEGN